MTLAYRDATVPDFPLSRWDARWKLTAVLLAGIAFALLRSVAPAMVAVMLTIGLALVSRIPIRVLTSRLSVLVIAVLPVLLILPFSLENGTLTAVVIGCRAVALGVLALIMLRTAPLDHTLTAANRLFVPGVLVQIAQLAYQYSLLFFVEARRLRIALRARGFRASTNTLTYRTLGGAAGTLLIRGGDRAERVADAMRTRGFDGRFRTLHQFRTTLWDGIGFGAMVAAAMALLLWDRL
jgi:cobalt/nickel transport system permease protein